MVKKNNIKKISSTVIEQTLNILIVIILLLIIIGVWYLVEIKILNNQYANICGFSIFEVATGSMANTIEIGDIVIVKITTDVKEQDIIVFNQDENLITHRLIRFDENDNLITKGDANNVEDQPVKKSQLIGKVVYILPKLGIIRKIILSPQILIMIISFTILLGIALKITIKPTKSNINKD